MLHMICYVSYVSFKPYNIILLIWLSRQSRYRKPIWWPVRDLFKVTVMLVTSLCWWLYDGNSNIRHQHRCNPFLTMTNWMKSFEQNSEGIFNWINSQVKIWKELLIWKWTSELCTRTTKTWFSQVAYVVAFSYQLLRVD